MKGKKGVMAEIILFAFVVLAIYSMANIKASLHSKYAQVSKEMPIGERQFTLYNTYSEDIVATYYIEKSAELSEQKAASALIDNGGYGTKFNRHSKGFYVNAPCGTYQGFVLWRNGAKECYPTAEIEKNNRLQTMTSLLNSYFTQYSTPFQTDYKYEIKDGAIIGKAASGIEIKSKGADNYKYTISPSFKIKDANPPEDLTELAEKAREIASECEKDFDSCTTQPQSAGKFTLDIGCGSKPDSTFKAMKICANDGKNTIKFAIKIEETQAANEAEKVKQWAASYNIPEKIALQVANLESAGTMSQYTDGIATRGDGGCSIGLMQINTCAHPECSGTIKYEGSGGCTGAKSCENHDLEDPDCNIETGMRMLKMLYDEGQSKPLEQCSCNGLYKNWDYALKRYNGCACDNDYVELVNSQDVEQYVSLKIGMQGS